MKDRTFLVTKDGNTYSYRKLLEDLYTCSSVPRYCYTPNTYEILKNILCSIICGVDLVLLDYDFSSRELESLGIGSGQINERVSVNPITIICVTDLIDKIIGTKLWKLTLFTSGTTGLPKKVTHSISSLVRLVRQSERHQNNIWALAYNPTHIAGIQVFFQAVLNANEMIEVSGLPRELVYKRIDEYQITNISATPTFYRMLLPIEGTYPSVRRMTSGGERFDPCLAQRILHGFPDAKFRNIYASTEAGSILESLNDRFVISDPKKCKIQGNKLFIHSSLLGQGDTYNEWYDTGDLVEIVDTESGEFIFINRESEMINVGGYKANPIEIEEALCLHPNVLKAKVWGRPNSVIGNILMADIVCKQKCSEREIREFLMNRLQGYKIPRIINFVEKIETTRSGKIKRG